MESALLPTHKLNIDRDEDRISALPDDLLLGIYDRLDLREAVRAGAVSTRWRHLPHRLSRLRLDVCHFGGATPVEIMEAFTAASCRLLSECKCAIKTLVLGFFPVSESDLSSIGRAVEDLANRGEIERLRFNIRSPYVNNTTPLCVELGQQFMSFSRACPVAFRCLMMITLDNLAFGHSDVADLIRACDKLKYLTLKFCRLVDQDQYSVLKIDTPCSGLQKLYFFAFRCTQIELVSVPKLSEVRCQFWRYENPPVRFGYVPELHDVTLYSHAWTWQAPFALSECLSRSSTNLSTLHLGFDCEMIWITPEHPKQLTAMFKNLTGVALRDIFPECDLSWTLFILEAAPSLQIFEVSRDRHSCVKTFKNTAEKTNVVWEPSKDWKHLTLKLMTVSGFEEEDKVIQYIRLVMERAVVLKRIELRGDRHPCDCEYCNDIDPERRFQVNEASWRRVKERLTQGSSSSSSLEIIMR